MISPSHFAYLDESYYTTEHDFGAISLISFPACIKENLENKINPIISQFPSEYKWSSFKSKKYLEQSKKIFTILFDLATRGCLRIDSIIWQTNDPRYPRNQTNTGDKLSVLYYLWLRDTMSKRWGINTSWSINIDEQRQIDWKELRDYIDYAGSRSYTSTILGDQYDLEWLRKNPFNYSIEEFQFVVSVVEPFVQIADIFAGVAAYSHNESSRLFEWLAYEAPQHSQGGVFQMPLSLDILEPMSLSSREINRFKFIKHIQDCCKSKVYQVSLHKKKGLHTFCVESPINFYYSGCEK